MKRSFLYSGPIIYKACLKLLHGKDLDQRYKLISQNIPPNSKVLEPACGPALLPDHLDPSCTYSGFDINEKFIKYAKERGLDVKQGDAKDKSNYKKSDVVVFCDALHHFGPEDEKKILENTLNNSDPRHLIICDPFKDYFMQLIPSWVPGSKKILSTWYNYVEQDGNNQVRLNNIRTRKELEDIMIEGFNIIPKKAKREIKNIGEDLIVTYNLQNI